MIQQTLSIIKPDAVARNLQGEILAMIQKSGLRIVAMKMIRLTRAQAEAFYDVHKERPFYGELVEYMTSGPVVCSVLEGEDAITAYRTLMGATNPANAAEGTIRSTPSTRPSPARRMGTTANFLPLRVGALVEQMGVSTSFSVRGRSRVAS